MTTTAHQGSPLARLGSFRNRPLKLKRLNAPENAQQQPDNKIKKAIVMAAMKKVIILPGNGCTPVRAANWYGWLESKLIESGVEVAMSDMPDPFKARENIWLPFIREKLGANENCIVVGHSSGAEAGMRLLEETRVHGLVLVSACHTDLGEASEAISGYYARPWEWAKIKANATFISQFASLDDPFIPIAEMHHVRDNLNTEYIEYTDRGHFMTQKFPELLAHVLEKAKSA